MDKQPPESDVGATLASILKKLESIDRLETKLDSHANKLESIDRLETKLDAASNRMAEELDILKTELNGISNARTEDRASITNLNKSVKALNKDIIENTNSQNEMRQKLDNVENQSNKTVERMSKLEEKFQYMEARENRKSVPKKMELVQLNTEKVNNPVADNNMRTKKTDNKSFSEATKNNSTSKDTDNRKVLVHNSTNNRDKEKTYTPPKTFKKKKDLFSNARKTIGLYPIKAHDILKWSTNEYYPPADDIPEMETERSKAVMEFLDLELKYRKQVPFTSSWSQEKNIMWVKFQDEIIVKRLYWNQADFKNDRIKLLKYTPNWAYERNKQLEIRCRLARENDPELRTQVRLGNDDLVLLIKRKGEDRYKRVNVEYFGELPCLQFDIDAEVSPGPPVGRDSHRRDSDTEDREEEINRKRKVRSTSATPPPSTKQSKPKVTDMSYDDPKMDSSAIPELEFL